VHLDDVRAARDLVGPILRPTPVEPSHALSGLAGRPVLLKPEHRQRTGSFKIRGAYNHIARLDRAVVRGVVAASAGNHGQGVALAAALRGLPARIYVPADAPLPKIGATRAYGAEVVVGGDLVDDCVATARAAAGDGWAYVPPFDDPLVIAGQGTVGLEIAEEAPAADVVVVPVGGGGLIAGIAVALAGVRPGTRVIGVEAEGAAKVRASLAAGHPVTLPRVATMADGIALKAPSERTLAHIAALVDDVVTVTEEQISAACLLLLERAKAVVEPAGAVGLAAVLAGAVPGGDAPVAVVLSGGNVDPLLLTRLIHHGLSAAGRYLVLRVVLDDRPGALAALTGALADLRLNVLSVEHHRAGVRLGVHDVEVLVTLETRDPDHRAEVVADLGRAGFRVDLR
jgi:threonine dehydratase